MKKNDEVALQRAKIILGLQRAKELSGLQRAKKNACPLLNGQKKLLALY